MRWRRDLRAPAAEGPVQRLSKGPGQNSRKGKGKEKLEGGWGRIGWAWSIGTVTRAIWAGARGGDDRCKNSRHLSPMKLDTCVSTSSCPCVSRSLYLPFALSLCISVSLCLDCKVIVARYPSWSCSPIKNCGHVRDMVDFKNRVSSLEGVL